MKIRINAGGRQFAIGIPTGLIFSKTAVWLYLKLFNKNMAHAQRYMPEDVDVSLNSLFDHLQKEAVYAICEELRRIKKKHGSWELVNVRTADGTVVKIFL